MPMRRSGFGPETVETSWVHLYRKWSGMESGKYGSRHPRALSPRASLQGSGSPPQDWGLSLTPPGSSSPPAASACSSSAGGADSGRRSTSQYRRRACVKVAIGAARGSWAAGGTPGGDAGAVIAARPTGPLCLDRVPSGAPDVWSDQTRVVAAGKAVHGGTPARPTRRLVAVSCCISSAKGTLSPATWRPGILPLRRCLCPGGPHGHPSAPCPPCPGPVPAHQRATPHVGEGSGALFTREGETAVHQGAGGCRGRLLADDPGSMCCRADG